MSVVNLVAFSDVHIGVYGSAVDSLGINMAFKSNQRCRDFVTEWCRLNRPDRIIFVGDLYRSAIGRPTQTEQMAAAEWFRDLAVIAPVVAKPGNHDRGESEVLGGVHALEIFAKMGLRMNVLEEEGWSLVTIQGVKVGLFHGMLAGVKLESGLMSDTVKNSLPKLSDAPPADLHILGDIHHRQFIGKNAAYCGALDRLNFGEEDESPSFWHIVVEKDDKTNKVKDITWTPIYTPARKFVTITDEDDVSTVDVKDAVVRFSGELNNLGQGELIQKLKQRGALEVTSVADTSELDESPSIFTSFVPSEAFAIWLDAQDDITQESKNYAQELLLDLVN